MLCINLLSVKIIDMHKHKAARRITTLKLAQLSSVMNLLQLSKIVKENCADHFVNHFNDTQATITIHAYEF